MARRPRNDSPDTWLHIMNRGVARRTLFERREDIEHFLSLVAEAREREELEVHAYCLMTTHYHLLARSPSGKVAVGMQRIQTEYSRWFNRSRKRDGPLVRGRYSAKEVHSDFYRRTVVRYIDWNPVRARVAKRADLYPYGSAKAYLHSSKSDVPWLERSWVEGQVRNSLGRSRYNSADYAAVFPVLPRRQVRVLELRSKSRAEEDSIEDLVHASPRAVRDWMRRKARLADGTQPGLPIVALTDLKRAVQRHARRDREAWKLGRREGWQVVLANLMRELCGLSFDEIGDQLDQSRSTVFRLRREHSKWIAEDEEYARRSSAVAIEALAAWKVGQ
ncbi:MAG: transposase [Planctomycetota bacterium]